MLRTGFLARGFAGTRTVRNSISVARRGLLTRACYDGPAKPPLLDQTVGEHFSSIVSQFGDRTAVISRHQNARISYYELDQKANSLAKGLLDLGVVKGDRVCVYLGNNTEYAVATYAVYKLGAILVPLNLAFTQHQLFSAISHLEASHLIISTETNFHRKSPRSNRDLVKLILNGGDGVHPGLDPGQTVKNIIIVDNSSGRVTLDHHSRLSSFNELLNAHGGITRANASRLHPDDIVNIQFTSGTTSDPKAACLTHRSILNNGNSIGDRMLLTETDIVCCPPPLFHCFGCILGYMATATHGSAIVFPSEAFDAHAALLSVQEYACTALYGVPTMFLAELELLRNGTVSRTGFEHLRTGIAAGSSIPENLMKKLHQELNLTELTICYGMTETSPVSAMTTTDDPLEKRLGSVGKLLPHVRAKVVDRDDPERILAVGEKGELAVSGYLVMKEYWGDQTRTDEVMIRDEERTVWMHTGDEACMDASGYIAITGRIKDLIIRGGENISPLEIENCLISHPDILEASVVGVKDELYGEKVVAFVVLREGKQTSKPVPRDDSEEEEWIQECSSLLKDWVKDRLSRHMVPKMFHSVKMLPKTPSGKIQKFKLKERVEQLMR